MTLTATETSNDTATAHTQLEKTANLESSYLMPTYSRAPVLFVRGKNSTLYDDAGKAYLDFISGIGVNVLGYDHPRIRKVLRESASLMHTSNLFYHPYQGLLAENLVKASGMSRAFFCNTGTESVEGALKLARAWQKKRGHSDKTEFVALTNSFHGRTMGALSVTAQEKYRTPFEPLIPGVRFVDAGQGEASLEAVREAINERTSAIIIETIQGESGIRPLPDTFLSAVRKACDATDTLMILDEVQCGLGRTGTIFAFEHTSVRPDILCVAKPLGLGVPLGAFLVAERAVDGLKAGDHGTTFGGGPLACRLSLEFFEMLNEGKMLKRISDTGDYFVRKLRKLKSRHPALISDVRGMGLMIGVELKSSGKQVAATMLERGYVMNCTHDVVLRFLPPYIIKKSEISAMVTTLEETMVEILEKANEGTQAETGAAIAR